MINKEGLLKRITIALSIVWMIMMLFYASSSAHDLELEVSRQCTIHAGACTFIKYWYMFFSRWLFYIIPSVLTFFILWIFDKDLLHKYDNLNKKTVRASICWICITFILCLGCLLSGYGFYSCGKYDCTNDGDIQEAILVFAILQIPLFTYWLIAWAIKGNTIFRSKNEIRY
jgi:hypothetical protein